jgi:hypothetical protein
MKIRKYREVFAVVVRRKPGPFHDFGGRRVYMSACELAEDLRGRYPNVEVLVVHQKLLTDKGEYSEQASS